jgi:hypothetical protein
MRILLPECRKLSAYVSSKGLYETIITTNENKEIAGKAFILDYGTSIKPGLYNDSFITNNIKMYGNVFVYKNIEKLKNPGIDLIKSEYLEAHFLSNANILVSKMTETTEISAEAIKRIEIKGLVKEDLGVQVFSDSEVLRLTDEDYQLFMNSHPYTFLVFDTYMNRRLFIYSYNSLYRERASLFRHVYKNIEDFNPRHITISKVLLPGIIAIAIEYEAEAI